MTDHRQPGGRTPPPREPDERLADWVDGRMSERDRVRFTAELRVNAQLRADLAAYERTVAMVREALQAPTAPLPRREVSGAAPSDGGSTLADRVLAQVQGQAPVRSFRVAGGGIAWRPVLWSCASAAALLALTLLLDSWSAEPVATGSTAVTELDTSSASAPNQGSALPLDRLLDPPPSSVLAQESLDLQAGTAATPNADPPVDPPSAELAEQSGATEPTATDIAGAATKRAELGARAGLGAAELGATAEPEAMARARVRRAAPGSPPDAVPAAPKTTPAPAAVPAPILPPGEQVSADEPRAEERSKEKMARLERALGDDDRPPAPGAPVAGATVPPPGDAEGSQVDKLRSAENFYLGLGRREAAAPWSLLLVDGVQPPGVQPSGVRAGAGGRGPAGPSTGGPAGPAAPAAPAGGGAMPTASEVEQRLDAFLATAVLADAAPVLEVPTARGTLRLWRLPLTELPKDLALAADRQQPGAPPPLEASWAVEGPQADVEVLLQRVNRFVRQPELSLRTGETAAPTLPPSAAASAEPSASPRAVVPARRQLVLRFRLRSR
jgi:hypothetical protein